MLREAVLTTVRPRHLLVAGVLFMLVGTLGLAAAVAQAGDGWSEDAP